MILQIILALTLTIFSSCNSKSTSEVQLKSKKETSFLNGDIIFQSSNSGQSKAIQLATHSVYSHCGILFQENGEWMVYEAVQPVVKTPFESWIKRGDNAHYLVKRLKNRADLPSKQLDSVYSVCQSFLGKDYDIYFNWSDDEIYCSELVWKAYQRGAGIEIGKRDPLKNMDLSHPEVKRIMKQRYGNEVPYDEWMISPGAIFDSELLVTIISKNELKRN